MPELDPLSTDLPLFDHLLLATEHVDHDAGAEAVALALARRLGRPLAAVLPLASNAELEAVAPQLVARHEAEASARRQALLAQAQAAGVALGVSVRRGPELWQEIVDEARGSASGPSGPADSKDPHGTPPASLLLIRRRGRRGLLANLLVGEMVNKVVTHAPCPVLVAPRGSALWQQRVLLALDPRAPDAGALNLAVGVARCFDLPLSAAVVLPTGRLPEAELAAADAVLAQAAQAAAAAGVALTPERLNEPRVHDALRGLAQRSGADLLVIGRRRPGAAQRRWMGSTAHKLLGLATCPVLVHVDG